MQVINIAQNTPEWLEFRKSHIGASEAATILGINPWETAYQLWQRKLGLLDATKTTGAMQRGIDNENAAREKFEALTGIKTKPVVLQHKDIHYMIASLDGISEDGKVTLELKCPNEATHEMARAKKIPEYYFTQCLHQFEVAKPEVHYYATYRNGEMNIVEVERDQAIIDKILESQADFYRRMTEFDAPPQKHKVVENRELSLAILNYKESYENSKYWQENLEKDKKLVLEIAGDECVLCDGIKITHYHEKGRIDYSAIKELENIDLDKYRKPPTVKSRISFT